MSEYTGMTPTVIVGLGGTGKEILIKIRRMIVEQYGSLDALPIVSFLHIDTEQNAKVSEPQTVLKQDISLRPIEQNLGQGGRCQSHSEQTLVLQLFRRVVSRRAEGYGLNSGRGRTDPLPGAVCLCPQLSAD